MAGAWLSPSHDGYVQPKAGKWITAGHSKAEGRDQQMGATLQHDCGSPLENIILMLIGYWDELAASCRILFSKWFVLDSTEELMMQLDSGGFRIPLERAWTKVQQHCCSCPVSRRPSIVAIILVRISSSHGCDACQGNLRHVMRFDQQRHKFGGAAGCSQLPATTKRLANFMSHIAHDSGSIRLSICSITVRLLSKFEFQDAPKRLALLCLHPPDSNDGTAQKGVILRRPSNGYGHF